MVAWDAQACAKDDASYAQRADSCAERQGIAIATAGNAFPSGLEASGWQITIPRSRLKATKDGLFCSLTDRAKAADEVKESFCGVPKFSVIRGLKHSYPKEAQSVPEEARNCSEDSPKNTFKYISDSHPPPPPHPL